ncbi:hypothetical protein H4S14_003289 [Agrobacterium vitis]|nr:hypothetical protein [Agrobacterium vitis]MBE1439524.1 hypothetical protein [Agrobacterium vitis]
MFNTAFTFGLTQFARSLSLPERLQKRPLRNATLEPWRFRNSSLDAMFYDIKTLTSDEAFYISDSLAAEGMVMIVPPTGQGMLTLCDSVDEYLLRGGLDVHTMAVAGIGGSAAGAAAFARNVADAVNAPVAAVVSGYGLGDIISEAMGSNFFFGPLGFLRHNFEMIDDLVGRPQLGDYARHKTTAKAPRRSSLDTDTVEALLMHEKLDFNLVTGHSKGNLIIAEALRSMATDAPERLETLGTKLKLVTFATRITAPPALEPPVSIMGELDWYGELNATAPATGTIRVPRCGHSTNSDMPGSLKITSLLRDALDAMPKQQPDMTQPAEVPRKEPLALKLVEKPEQAPLPEPLPEPEPEPAVETAELAPVVISEIEPPATEEPALPEPTLPERAAQEPLPEPEAAPQLTPAPSPEPGTLAHENTEVMVADKPAEITAPVAATSQPTPRPSVRPRTRSGPRGNRKK